ncbi:flippase [candidate division KSB1 bacterium]|nr:flippase [candidate division KSB1 bacterium]
MSGLKRTAKNLLYLLLGGIIASGFEFIIEVLLARRLTDTGYGYWSLSQSIVIYILIFCDFGLAIYGAREIARFRQNVCEYISNVFALRTLLSVGTFVIFTAVVLMLNISMELKLLLILGCSWIFPQAVSPEFAFQGIERMEGIAIWRILNFFFYLILVYFLIHDRNNTVQVAACKTFAAVLAVIVLWPLLRRMTGFSRPYIFRTSRWPEYLRVSAILLASVFVIKVYYTFDTLALGFLQPVETVGWYNVAYKIILQFVGLTLILQTAAGPVFSRLRDDKIKLQQAVYFFYFLSTVIAGICCGLLFFLSDKAILLIYGIQYNASISILKLLSFSLYFIFIQVGLLTALAFCGFERAYLKALGIGSLVNIVLNVVLIYYMSYTGAAVATIVSNVVICIAGFLYFGKLVYTPRSELKLTFGMGMNFTVTFLGCLLLPVDDLVKSLIFTGLFVLLTLSVYRSDILRITKTFITS